jgi:hypothetical protein
MKPLVMKKEHNGLTMLKYSKRVFWDNLWNDELIECRGRVVDSEGNVVVNPFTKVFNYLENDTKVPLDEVVLAVEKINGFMAALTWHDEAWLVTTTGSFDSKYVEIAKRYIGDSGLPELNGVTYLFEIVAPEDPHIIPELEGAYLLGYRTAGSLVYTSYLEKEKKLDSLARQFGYKRPKYFQATFGEVLELSKKVRHEGFCIYGSVNFKLKSPWYLQSKAIARSNRRLALDEEFSQMLLEMPKVLGEQERLEFIRNYFKV